MASLQGKYIVITGASGGIGKALALEVAKRGATPVLMARSLDKLEQVAAQIKLNYQIEAPVYPLDVRKQTDIEQTFKQLLTEIPAVDVLVNNAGYGKFDEIADLSLDDMSGMFEVNVYGLIACTKMVLPSMLEQNQGHIINIASQAGKIATPKSSVYAATKHAVLGFTNSMRMELYDTNIFVTSVNPGPIRTEFFDIADSSGSYKQKVEKWMLEPEYVAKRIADAMFTRTREINLPGWMNMASKLYQVFPGVVEKLGGKAFRQK
ncbi:MAG: SDR family oxidoreductase [Bacillota bacterium]|uniref:SDR family NAD(P)-dependent oxidoreductase n=1 Tax=Bacillus sp. RO2 TaxID=2723913 RepID=UPI00145FB2DF|nr:SDR family oxidoreductase [Bacillus sp. RO2]MEA3321155.1 SDR family oxidoreductase [Bacillota bacterium]NMH74219.1 SDR family oxidoreductase [Bacillus sp. RO2]